MDKRNRFPAESMVKFVAQACPAHLDNLENTQLLVAFERDPNGMLYFRMVPVSFDEIDDFDEDIPVEETEDSQAILAELDALEPEAVAAAAILASGEPEDS